MSERTFKLIAVSDETGISFEKGVYTGKRAAQAALKAFNQYCRSAKIESCKLHFTIEETTRNSKRKRYMYTGIREERAEPKIIERANGSRYIVKYASSVIKNAAIGA